MDQAGAFIGAREREQGMGLNVFASYPEKIT
jgi:hypothetical protein